MNHITALIAVSIISAMQLACRAENKDASRWLQLRSEIREMRECMAKDGAYAFVTNAATPKTAPHIHSQYWLMLIPETNIALRQYEQGKRDFGLDMIGQLERYAKQKIDIKDISTLENLGTDPATAQAICIIIACPL